MFCHAKEAVQGKKNIPKDECVLFWVENCKQQGLTRIGAGRVSADIFLIKDLEEEVYGEHFKLTGFFGNEKAN